MNDCKFLKLLLDTTINGNTFFGKDFKMVCICLVIINSSETCQLICLRLWQLAQIYCLAISSPQKQPPRIFHFEVTPKAYP